MENQEVQVLEEASKEEREKEVVEFVMQKGWLLVV